jgi:hypothetical protein
LTIDIHEKAHEALDARANEFLNMIVERPLQPELPKRVWGERHVAFTITDADIIGPMRRTITDGFGAAVSMDFYVGDRHFDVPNSAYEILLNLRDQILKVPALQNTLSNQYVEDAIVSWCEKTLSEAQQQHPFSDFLVEKAEIDIKPLNVLIPIANTRTEKEFDFGPHRIVRLTQKKSIQMLGLPDTVGAWTKLFQPSPIMRDDFSRTLTSLRLPVHSGPQFC